MGTSGGHLFVVDGDLTKIDCDALLIPTDRALSVTSLWSDVVDRSQLREVGGFPEGVRASRLPAAANADSRVPEVWLGDIGRFDADENWYADGLVDFVRRAREPADPSRATNRPRRLAVNVAGSGWGGSEHDKGVLYRTIVPRLRQVAAEVGVDVVVVCWGAKSYSAAQLARWKDRPAAPVLGDLPTERINELAQRARTGDLVLFLGAGVSIGAGVQSWQGLLEDLHRNAPHADDVDATALGELDVRDQAQIIRGLYPSDDAYQAALAAQFGAHLRYSLVHGLLAGLGTIENVTTNYDTLFETAASTAGRRCHVLPYDRAVAGERWLLKLHGSIEHPADLVLTRGDYLALPTRSGALFGLLQALLMTKHMLFVGYSLKDDSFHRVMHEVRQVLGPRHQGSKVGTVLVLERDAMLERLWGDVLHIVPMPVGDGGNAARSLEIVLDEIALRASDVAAFLLDPTYGRLLDDHERAIQAALLGARALADGGGPIDVRVREALRAFDVK